MNTHFHLLTCLSQNVNGQFLRMSARCLTNVLMQQQVSAGVHQMLGYILWNIVHWVSYRDLEVEDLQNCVVHLDHVVIPAFSPLLITQRVCRITT